MEKLVNLVTKSKGSDRNKIMGALQKADKFQDWEAPRKRHDFLPPILDSERDQLRTNSRAVMGIFRERNILSR